MNHSRGYVRYNRDLAFALIDQENLREPRVFRVQCDAREFVSGKRFDKRRGDRVRTLKSSTFDAERQLASRRTRDQRCYAAGLAELRGKIEDDLIALARHRSNARNIKPGIVEHAEKHLIRSARHVYFGPSKRKRTALSAYEQPFEVGVDTRPEFVGQLFSVYHL